MKFSTSWNQRKHPMMRKKLTAREAREKIRDLVAKNDQKLIKNLQNDTPESLHFTSLHIEVGAGKVPTSLYFTSKSFYQKLQALHFTSKSFFQNHRFFPLHFQLHFRTPLLPRIHTALVFSSEESAWTTSSAPVYIEYNACWQETRR